MPWASSTRSRTSSSRCFASAATHGSWSRRSAGSRPASDATRSTRPSWPSPTNSPRRLCIAASQSASDWLARETGGVPHKAIALGELITVWLANLNPAVQPFRELFDDAALAGGTAYRTIGEALRDYFESRPRFGPAHQNLIDMLRAPAMASPDSLEGQLEYIRHHWADLLGEFLRRLLLAMDVLKEEQVAIWLQFHPPGPRPGAAAPQVEPAALIPSYAGQAAEAERFSQDEDWMSRTVLVAKSTYVWLDQLSRFYGRAITHLDQIPDEEFETLARRGFNALWLIGLWERSWRVAAHQAALRQSRGGGLGVLAL